MIKHKLTIEVIVDAQDSDLCGDGCPHLEWDVDNERYYCFLFNDIVYCRKSCEQDVFRCKTCKEAVKSFGEQVMSDTDGDKSYPVFGVAKQE